MSVLRRRAYNYDAIHQLIKAKRGNATLRKCIACPQRALDWAYTHIGGPDERWDPDGQRLYSINLGHYVPMCRSCHMALDTRPRDSSSGRYAKEPA